MKRCRVLYLLLALFAVGVVVRIFHFPFREAAVLRVVPVHATAMSRHITPGPRWRQMLKDGVADPWFYLAGEDEDAPGKALLENSGFAWLLDTLGKRYLATAYVEHFHGRPAPAFIMSAWVGGLYTHLARMGFLDHAFSDFEVTRTSEGVRIWHGTFPDLPEGFQHISFGVYEGVMFGVASEHALGAIHLYASMRQHRRSGAEALLALDATEAGQQLDYARWRSPVLGNVRMGILQEGASLRFLFHAENRFGAAGSEALSPSLADLLPVLQPTTALLVGTTSANAEYALTALPLAQPFRVVGQLLSAHVAGGRSDATVVVWIANRAHGGRLMRLRVPAAGLAVEAPLGASVRDVVDPVLLRLNRLYGTAWEVVPYGDQGVMTLQSGTRDWYGRLARDERAGVAVWNGYFLLHSSAATLDALLEHFRQNAASDPIAFEEYMDWYTHVDPVATADILRMGVSSFGIWQVMTGQPRDRDREWLLLRLADVIERFATMEMRIVPDADGMRGFVVLERLQ